MEQAGDALSLRNVVKRFGDTVACDDITMDVAAGEFFSLLGPSGCGKTTLLRLIGGFEVPDAGLILIDGADVASVPPHRRPVNTVFQSYALFPHLNVFDNVAYGLRRRGVRRREIARRAGDMLEIVGLAGMDRRKPATLSGGQQQRVALARALVNEPVVLLLDEPLGALDLALRRQMQHELKRIQREVGITFVFVTHDQEEAMAMSDRIAVVQDGRIRQTGSPEDVYERPGSEFVATFLGSANLLSGLVARREPGWAAVSLDAGSVVWVPGERVDGAREVTVGIRPEKLRILDGDPADDNAVDGVVEETTFTGVGFQHRLRTASGEAVTVYEPNLGSAGAQPGDRVTAAWRPEHTFALERAPS